MAQKLTQTQAQTQTQQTVQHLSQQQMLQVKLLEMPITQLEEQVVSELADNPALEPSSIEEHHDHLAEEPSNIDMGISESEEQRDEREQRADELERALSIMGSDDRMEGDEPYYGNYIENTDYPVWREETSFYDTLREQAGEYDLTDQQRDIMEYLIGSLDEDGLLRKDNDTLCDELAIHQNIYTTVEEIDEVVKILQRFDPPGIGAHTLQECLLLQVARHDEGEEKQRLTTLLTRHFDDFMNNRWGRIATAMKLDDEEGRQLKNEAQRLNPKPGAPLGETIGRSTQQITPDFIVDTHEDDSVSFTINRGQVPELHISESFTELSQSLKDAQTPLSRSEKEALTYAKEKVEKAKGFITALQQRQLTMSATMSAIIKWQLDYFREGDENLLRPMKLKDIAEKTHLDISTISRVSNQKYAQTRWGTFPLRHFFTDGYTTEDGKELSTRQIKNALKEIVDHEDKHHPLNDEALRAELAKHGFPIARRTVTKYREQLGIPKATLRK
ncbi:MAG: RNA polymerase factor sigma-54 [Prevotella sp.]|nr:RNA polymerase factor sigma-54 [Prevotella sp.]